MYGVGIIRIIGLKRICDNHALGLISMAMDLRVIYNGNGPTGHIYNGNGPSGHIYMYTMAMGPPGHIIQWQWTFGSYIYVQRQWDLRVIYNGIPGRNQA